MTFNLVPDDYYPYLEYLPSIQLCVNLFMIVAPIFSYGSTCWLVYNRKTSHGFSLDICASMLMAALLRIYYYHVSPYEATLLYQLLVMILIQSLLLATALRYRPGHYDPDMLHTCPSLVVDLRDNMAAPHLSLLSRLAAGAHIALVHVIRFFDVYYQRPFQFWQWKDHRSYWRFLLGFFVAFAFATMWCKEWQWYAYFIGTAGLFIEALLPLPQILLLRRLQLIENFKVVLLLSWLGGDITKMSYLVYGTNDVSVIFLAAGLFQMVLDLVIAAQYLKLRLAIDVVTDSNPSLDTELKPFPLP